MIPVVYSEPDFRTKKEEGVVSIFCIIRKRWLLLTEEEWVRQNFVQHLITAQACPASLIAVEKELLLNGLKKRFDILVYDAYSKPWLMVECKKSSVALSETVLQQVLNYNMALPVPFLVITNGRHTMGWQHIGTHLELLAELPQWKSRTPF